jgi:hypothetical protein
MKRTYTGNKDGIAAGEHPQLTALVKELLHAYPQALWNNGTYGVRNMRAKTFLSVHATGRAADISWRNMGDGRRGVAKGGRRYAMEAMNYLVKNADALGIEIIIDYFPSPYGRASKCDRNMAWRKYTKATVSGAPKGDWFHTEVDGKKSSDQIKAVFAANPPSAVVVPPPPSRCHI